MNRQFSSDERFGMAEVLAALDTAEDQAFPDRNDKQMDKGVLMHWVTDGEDKGWVHTHGMDKYGLPELEIRGIPNFLAESAAAILREVSRYMREPGQNVRVGETMATSPRTRFRFVRSVPIPGQEEHFTTERWQIVDVDFHCDDCGQTSKGGA